MHPPFLTSQVTLVAHHDSLMLRNDPECLGLEDQKDVGLRTEMSISANNLHAYEAGPMSASGVAVTFSLREFKVCRSNCPSIYGLTLNPVEIVASCL